MDTLKIGKRLVELRKEEKQKEVACAIGVSQSTYAMYERGKRVPSDEKKKKIAEYFHVTVQFIFLIR